MVKIQLEKKIEKTNVDRIWDTLQVAQNFPRGSQVDRLASNYKQYRGILSFLKESVHSTQLLVSSSFFVRVNVISSRVFSKAGAISIFACLYPVANISRKIDSKHKNTFMSIFMYNFT